MNADETPAVFVTGATGSVGAAAVASLVEKGVRVVAAVRDASATGALPAGAEHRVFEFSADPEAMRRALEGCDRLFLMRPPPIEDVEQFLFPLIDAAMAMGIRQIVFLSLQGVEHNKGVPHYRVEKYLEQIGAPFTFLRPNFFMQNLSTPTVTTSGTVTRSSSLPDMRSRPSSTPATSAPWLPPFSPRPATSGRSTP